MWPIYPKSFRRNQFRFLFLVPVEGIDAIDISCNNISQQGHILDKQTDVDHRSYVLS